MKFYIIFTFILSFYSCKNEINHDLNQKKIKVNKDSIFLNNKISKKTTLIDSIFQYKDNNLGTIYFKGLDRDNFIIEKKNDTIFIIKQSYEGIESLKIEFENKNIDENLKGNITYGVSQNTLDDIPGPDYLNFSLINPIIIAKNDDSQFPLDKYIYDYSELATKLQTKYFKEIRNESYNYQLDFYKKIIDEKPSRYIDCCPEYIIQAQDFLTMSKNNFKTLIDLSVEPSYIKVTLDLGSTTWLVFYN